MGTDVIGQFDGKHSIVFMPEESESLQAEYKANQLVRCKTTRQGQAIGKVLEQSNLLHACFKLVAENSGDTNHATIDAVKMACKIDIDFRDPRYCFVRPDGGVQLAYRSFSIYGPNALKGAERDATVKKAFNWAAERLGVTVDRLVEVAQERMAQRSAE
ncbi:MAG: hypothetical protein P1P89_22230 [Desulfobacterales bacterium]|nr:hypothetical protein [Desulfobacterales bacterium]